MTKGHNPWLSLCEKFKTGRNRGREASYPPTKTLGTKLEGGMIEGESKGEREGDCSRTCKLGVELPAGSCKSTKHVPTIVPDNNHGGPLVH